MANRLPIMKLFYTSILTVVFLDPNSLLGALTTTFKVISGGYGHVTMMVTS